MSNQRRLAIFMPSLALLLLLAGCTSIRPVTKIGLIAPFEGLYRESGYAALEAMRQAIDECAPPNMDVLPLALDDSGDPAQAQRATQKLLVDPSVKAIVGPLLLDSIPAVSSILTDTNKILWYVPPLIAVQDDFRRVSSGDVEVAVPQSTVMSGYIDPLVIPQWLDRQMAYISNETKARGVVLLGKPEGWIAQTGDYPSRRVDTIDYALASLQEGEVVLWLGRPDIGERWLTALREKGLGTQFWIADQAGMDVFLTHTQDRKDFHWFIWTNSEYNLWLQLDENAQQFLGRPTDMTRYTTYRATCLALQELGSQTPVTPSQWELHSQSLETFIAK